MSFIMQNNPYRCESRVVEDIGSENHPNDDGEHCNFGG